MLNDKQVQRLNKTMFDNLQINLADLKNNTPTNLFGKRLNYYCYLLAMLRGVIDFTDFAYAQGNEPLGEALDAMYQEVHVGIVKRTNQRFPCFHLDAPVTKRIIIGRIYPKLLKIRSILHLGPTSAKQKSKKVNQHEKNNEK